MTNRDIECLFVEIEFNNIKMNCRGSYIAPRCRYTKLFWLFNIIESLNPLYQSCYLMGDYNIDLLKHSTHNPTSEFLDLMFSNSFIHLINKSSRITPKSATLIDNIFANKYDNENKYMTGILTSDMSDHYFIYLWIKTNLRKKILKWYAWLMAQIWKNMSTISRIMTGHL